MNLNENEDQALTTHEKANTKERVMIILTRLKGSKDPRKASQIMSASLFTRWDTLPSIVP